MENGKKEGLRAPRNPHVVPMLARLASSASGIHENRERAVAKGWRRHPKYRTREDWSRGHE